jgi:predicted small lipoprotein YifL
LTRYQLSVARALALVLALSLLVAGCGRKGPLTAPPDASIPTPPPAAQGSTNPAAAAGAAQPAPVQAQTLPPAPAQRKTFILDPLIQ